MDAVVPAGNLYCTAEELSRFYQMLADDGVYAGRRILQPATIRRATRPANRLRYDHTLRIPMRYSEGLMLGANPVGLYGPMTGRAYGHLGFMNILGWADPAREVSAGLLVSGKAILGGHLIALGRLLATISGGVAADARGSPPGRSPRRGPPAGAVWLRGGIALAADAFTGTVDIVQGVHRSITRSIGRINPAAHPVGRVSDFVYGRVRDIGSLSFAGAGQLAGLAETLVPARKREIPARLSLGLHSARSTAPSAIIWRPAATNSRYRWISSRPTAGRSRSPGTGSRSASTTRRRRGWWCSFTAWA